MDNLKRLNLGCGMDIREGYINVDKFMLPNVDVIHNLDVFPYPFDDNSINEIIFIDCLEHLKDVEAVIEECYRILKVGAEIIINVPYFSFHGTFYYMNHKPNFFGYKTFDEYTNGEGREYYYKARFDIIYRRITFDTGRYFTHKKFTKIITTIIDSIINLRPIVYERWFAWIFPARSIHYKLKKVGI